MKLKTDFTALELQAEALDMCFPSKHLLFLTFQTSLQMASMSWITSLP